MKVQLKNFTNEKYSIGRGKFIQILWFITNILILNNPLNPLSSLRKLALEIFGASIGKGVVIKPGVNIKFPWKLTIGSHSWIGENVWLDNIDNISIGSNVCISQGSYLCTGNHDWSDPKFGLITNTITLEEGVWVGAKCVLLPGVCMRANSVLTAGSVLSESTECDSIYQGNPAVFVKKRKLNNT